MCSNIFLLLIFGIFGFGFLAAVPSVPAPPAMPEPTTVVEMTPTATAGANMMRVDHSIESLEVRVLESFPVQVEVTVTGWIGDGCEADTIIRQNRADDLITLEIYRQLPADAICTMIARQFTETIRLDSEFSSGIYSLNVNGTLTTFTV
jgi:hypothetical protein